MFIKKGGKTRHLESKCFKVAVDQHNIFTVKGFKMLKTDKTDKTKNKKLVEDERRDSEGLTTEENTIW